MTRMIGQDKPSLEDLVHYGVKGMKWGVRKDETGGSRPSAKSETTTKEVSPEVQQQREVRAKAYEAKAEKYQKQLDIVNAKKITYWNKSTINDQRKQLEALRDTATKNAENMRQGRMTEEQKKMIKGAALAVGILAAAGVYYEMQSGQGRAVMSRGKEFLTRNDFAWKRNSELARKDMSADEIFNKVVKGVNPDFGEIGTKMNCRRCTFAYEMRRRGYDVMATRTSNASGQTGAGLDRMLGPMSAKVSDLNLESRTFAVSRKGIVEEVTPEVTLKRSLFGEHEIHDNYEGNMSHQIFQALGRQPNGARGELTVGWKVGGAHSVAWEIIDGKPVVFDCQTGERFSSNQALFGKMFNQIGTAGYTRLDDKSLNDPFLRRWVKNA